MTWLRTKVIVVFIIGCGIASVLADFVSVFWSRLSDGLFVLGIFSGVYLLTSHKNKQMSELRDANALLLLENQQQQDAITVLNKDLNQLREQMTPTTEGKIPSSRAFRLFDGKRGGA